MKLVYLFKKQKLKEWLVRNAEGPRATIFLGAISFIESIFFPIPPDFILMTILAARRQSKWAYYAAVTTITSMLGGVVMYFLGKLSFHVFGEAFISFYDIQSRFDAIAIFLQHKTFLAILFGAIVPIPESFKIVALAGGVFKVNLPIFIVASIIGRGARFFLVGYFMKVFGHRITSRIYRHLNLISLVTFVFILFGTFIYLLLK
jgi:membrane protein YqaA with SNARE-associated domain